MLLNLFKKKYGEPISIVIYPKSDKISFCFPKDRWVKVSQEGEMSWDGKKNLFNIIKDEQC